jgi:hypothetical protein
MRVERPDAELTDGPSKRPFRHMNRRLRAVLLNDGLGIANATSAPLTLGLPDGLEPLALLLAHAHMLQAPH